MRVALSSAGTLDLDEDSLRYVWTIRRRDGTVVERLSAANPSFTFTRPGAYTASLTVTDPQGLSATSSVDVTAGNAPPVVGVDLVDSNKSFFFAGVPVRYAVRVTDREDGSLQAGTIPAGRVAVTADYMKERMTTSGPPAAVRVVDQHATGRRLIEGSTCLSCHQMDRTSIGPSYSAVARRYRGDSTAVARLVRKIREGGSGAWGKVTMPAHPQITEAQASAMARYILSLGERRTSAGSLPVRGAYTPPS
jgi:cytochrome c